MADKLYELLGTDSSAEDTPADPSMGYIARAFHRQQNDLLGLTLQPFNNTIPDNEMKISSTFLHNNSLQAVPDEKIAACPFHRTLLVGFHAIAVTSRATTSDPKSMLLPMERYLAESLAERYALVSISHLEIEDWARYSGCLCGK
jgi:hypothetical protein